MGILLPASTYIVDGAGQAARVATALATPLGVLWLLMLTIAVWCLLQRQKSAAGLFLVLFVFIGVTFNGRFANWCMAQVEHPGIDLEAANVLPFEAILVLGGGASVKSNGIDELNDDGERLFSAAQMWHAGQCKRVICSDFPVPDRTNPVSLPHNLLASVGVPDNAIIELVGENTLGEMRALRHFLDSPEGKGIEGKLGLITSAFHMNRAVRLASSQNIDVVPIPCAFRAVRSGPWSPRHLVPSTGAGANVAMALKERLARIVGR